MLATYLAARALAPLDAEPLPDRRGFERWVSLPHGEYESLFYPMAAISLLAPFTIHFLVYALFASDDRGFPGDFDAWIALAGAIAFPAHAALVVHCHRFAKAKTEALGVVADDDGATLNALFLTGVFAAVPGALFFVLPPLMIAVLTGLFFLPAMFGIFSAVHFRERMLLDRLEQSGMEIDAEEAFEAARTIALSSGSLPEARAGALRFLVRRYDRERVKEVIDAAIRSGEPLVFRTALIVALDIRHRPRVEDVEDLARRATGSTAVHVAQLLGCYRTPLAQRTLLTLLHDGLPDVRIAAVRSLGRTGDLSAIIALRRIAVRHLAERGLDRAVEDAVKRIQDRCAVGPKGALALAEPKRAGGEVGLIDP
jgi:hypothetical protein